MKTDLISKATFSEVYRYLRGKPDSDIFNCFKSLFGVSLLCFPALLGKEIAGIVVPVSVIGDVATGATLAGAGIGAIVSRAAKDAFALFKNKDHGNYADKYEQMQIAQVMLVYAAYFDTISQCLPDENGEIALTPDAKRKISRDGVQGYLKLIGESLGQQNGMHKLLDREFALPVPTQTFSSYKAGLKEFYAALNAEILKFFENLSFWKELEKEAGEIDRAQKEYFSDLLHKLPEMALRTYAKQYFELSREFPEFAVWANYTEHSRMEEQIDIGFKNMAEQLRELCGRIGFAGNEALDTLAHYRTRYTDWIGRAVIEERKDDFDEGIVLPLKKDIFIPQAFEALIYQRPMQLEQNDTWNEAFSGQEIGQYIRSILCHPKYGELPMLILGLPGAGKTLLCHMLAAQILSAEYYVIIIRLRDAVAEDTVMKQINAQIENDLGDNCSWNDLRKAPLDKPLLLIFDGYDELLQASGKTYSNYINKIAEFQAEQRSVYHIFVRCIITSRMTLIDKASIPRNCHILRLCDFDLRRIDEWCRIWNGANEQYFNAHNLKKLEIAPQGRVRELAGQPLLLLMLALYDINSNRLQKQANISRTELYYKLIGDFIKREKEKDEGFARLAAEKQENVIRGGFRHLGIAALGMYNRRQLYIRTTELNRDIAFLERDGVTADDTDENALEEADRHVAGFFFVHSSRACVQSYGRHSRTAAYEFLHNTFGEFLTAYFILDVTFRLIRRQMADAEEGEAFSWPEKLKKEWHTGLAYAPLFTRPVVLNMVHELSAMIADEKGIKAADAQSALDNLFREEIKQIITGEIFSKLNDTLSRQGNPFKHPELMVHVAVYSVNLILLRLVVCSDRLIFTKTLGDDTDWQKLTHIWRYAFSEEELLGLSCLIRLNHSAEGLELTYSFDEEAPDRATSLSRLNRLRNIADSLGDDVSYAVLGAFNAPADQKIHSVLSREGLKLETQYALNAVIMCLTLSEPREGDLVSCLHELYQCCVKEQDIWGMYVYWSLFHSLTDMEMLGKGSIVYLFDKSSFKVLYDVLLHVPLESRWFFLSSILQGILGCAENLPNHKKIFILQDFTKYYIDEIKYINTNLPWLDSGCLCAVNLFFLFSKVVESSIENGNKEEIGHIYYSFLGQTDICKLFSWKELDAVMRVCQVLRKKGSKQTGGKIFNETIYQIQERNPALFLEKCSAPCLSSLIECCFYFPQGKEIFWHKNKSALRYCYFGLYNGIEDIAKILLPSHEQAFYFLMCLLYDDDDNLSRYLGSSLPTGLNNVINRYGSQLSNRTLKKIRDYGELTHNKAVCLSVEKITS